jgi:hypothetical protein
MLSFIYNHDAVVAKFIADFNNRSLGDYGRCKTIGVIDEEGKLIGGFVYYNYDPEAGVIELGVATTHPKRINRTIIRRMFEYPFIEAGCQMLVVRSRADREDQLSLLARFNFNLTLIPRMYGRNEDGVIGTLTDDQWLDSKFSRHLYRDAQKREAA